MIIWMEIRFDNGIVENYVEIESIINITSIDNLNMLPLDLIMFERFR